jgi:tellurite resistance protein TehA-like permease
VGLATIINMIVFVCVPVWGHGMAILAWVLWWIDSVIALAVCFYMTWVMLVLPTPHICPQQTLIPASLAYAILLLTEFTECQTGEASWRK